jgi:ferric-dicitrate binding protein FerR (iron transport regulator)
MRRSERIGELLFRFIRQELSPEDERELNEWRAVSPENEAFFQEATDPENIRRDLAEMYASKDEVARKIRERYPDFPVEKEDVFADGKRKISLSIMIKVAATILLFGIGYLFYNRFHESKKLPADQMAKVQNNIIQPGGNRALLILSNGDSLAIDRMADGKLSSDGSVSIEKKDSGELVYSGNGSSSDMSTAYNILQTPRGGQFSIVLSDGTRIWLNAASRLHYPSYFSGNERRVELTGEAYFEVAKNPKAPFHVVSGKTEVEVLGTHFDVAAYPDEEAVSTTLIEGRVRVKKDQKELILNPGQEALAFEQGPIQLIPDADTQTIIAWKEGKTVFKNASIQSIMRAISRWYDVDVVFEGELPNRQFTGSLPRNTNLSELLTVLEKNNIHFHVEGRRITVTP